MQNAMNGPIQPPAPSPGQGIRFFDALKFIFTMENAWGNILTLSLLLLIPVVGQITMYGWYCEIMQRLARHHPKPIPQFKFSDFGHYLSRGVSPFVTQMLLTMPFSMVMGVIGGGVGMALAITTRTAPHHGRGEPPMALLAVYGVVILASILMGPFIAIVINAGVVRAELSEELGKALTLSGILGYIKRTWFTTLYSSFVYGFLASFVVLVGMLCCYVGIFPAAVIVSTGMTHLRFQIYQSYLAKGGEPIPIKAAVPIPSEQAGS
jgi:hypothetical protein